MQIVDLRDDPRMDMMLSSNIGSAIGQGFAVQQQRKQLDQQKETERKQQEFIVTVLGNESLSTQQKREAFINPDSPVSQNIRERMMLREMKSLYPQGNQPDLRQGADGRYYTIQNGQATAVEGMPGKAETETRPGSTAQVLSIIKSLDAVGDDGKPVLSAAAAQALEGRLKTEDPEAWKQWKTGSLSSEGKDLESILAEHPQDTKRRFWDNTISPENAQAGIKAYQDVLISYGMEPDQARNRATQEYSELLAADTGKWQVYPDIDLQGQQPQQPQQGAVAQAQPQPQPEQPQQQPPHKKLTPFWPKMNDEEKQTAILLVQQGMDVNQIIKALKND